MKHFTAAALAASLGLLVCGGCGDTPMQAAGGRLTSPPKPAAPPAGAAAEKPVKPGTEPPTQLAGPQLKALVGTSAPVKYGQPDTPNSNPANGNALPTTSGGPDVFTPTPSAPPAVVPQPTTPAPNGPPPLVEKSLPGGGPPGTPIGPGFTGKGQDYGNGDAGIITVPISTLFSVKEQIVLNQITGAMNVFKTYNGRNPKSEEEFMKEVIKANAIKLPELPEGSKYQYDPASGQLMVVGPKTK